MALSYASLVIIAVSIGSFTYGFNFGTPSNIIGFPAFVKYFDVDLAGPDPKHAASMQGAIVGVFFAGGFFGSFAFAWLSDKFGRVRALQAVCVATVIAAIISVASVNIGMLLAGRILSGFAGGGLNIVPPLMQSELSPASHRGRNVGFHGFMFVAGLSCCGWIGFGLFFLSGRDVSWRVLLGLQAVSPLVLLGLSVMLPESPRWLLLNGRDEEALAVLNKLYAEEGVEVAVAEQSAIRAQIQLDAQHDTTWKGLFSRGPTRRRLLLGAFIMVAQQSTGQNVLFGFQVNVLATLGLTDWQPLLVAAFYVTWAAILNLVGGVLLDIAGRRKMMLVGLGGACVSCAIHTALLIEYSGTDNKAGAGAAVAFLFLFITFFAPGVDVTSYVCGTEIYPTYMRARGLSVTIATYFCFAALYVCVSSTAVAEIGYKFNLVFVVSTAVFTAVMYFVLPETKGLSLEGISALFGEEAVGTVDESGVPSTPGLERKEEVVVTASAV